MSFRCRHIFATQLEDFLCNVRLKVLACKKVLFLIYFLGMRLLASYIVCLFGFIEPVLSQQLASPELPAAVAAPAESGTVAHAVDKLKKEWKQYDSYWSEVFGLGFQKGGESEVNPTQGVYHAELRDTCRQRSLYVADFPLNAPLTRTCFDIIPAEGNFTHLMPTELKSYIGSFTPEQVSVGKSTTKGGTMQGFLSMHFLLCTDNQTIPASSYAKFLQKLEFVHNLLQQSPVNLVLAKEEFYQTIVPIYLFSYTEDYIAAGGMKGRPGVAVSAGVAGGHVLMDGQGVRDIDAVLNTAIHEMVHVIEPAGLASSSLAEGYAQYYESYAKSALDGKFEHEEWEKNRIEANGGSPCLNPSSLERDNTIRNGGDLRRFIFETGGEGFGGSEQCVCMNYARARMIFTYFLHMDGDGDGRHFKEFLKIMQERGDPGLAEKRLLFGRTWEEVYTSYHEAWHLKHVKTF